MKKKSAIHSSRIEVLRLEENSYHIFTYATLKQKRIRMLIDTGASRTLFDSNWLEKKAGLPLREHDQQATGISENMSSIWVCCVPSFTFCHLELKKRWFPALNLRHVNENYKLNGHKPIHGIIGSDLLFEYNAIIHFPDQKLILQP